MSKLRRVLLTAAACLMWAGASQAALLGSWGDAANDYSVRTWADGSGNGND